MNRSSSVIPIRGIVKNYAWGSFQTLAEHRGAQSSEEPEAELWFGDSPHGPALLLNSSQTLNQLTEEFGQLPFLAKILAVESPLSLQVHPALSDLRRLESVKRDDNHKPEMIVALSQFDALIGLASKEEILGLVEKLDSEHARRIISEPLLKGSTVIEILNHILGVEDHLDILDEVLAKARNLSAHHQEWLHELIALYAPNLDPLALLLCNLVRLAPGESVYLPPRCIHAYLRGTAVEAMANSDNVIRGGLTKKPIDKKNFLALLKESNETSEIITPRSELFEGTKGGARHWQPPIDDFSLSEFHGVINQPIHVANFAIAFVWRGAAVISDPASESISVKVEGDKGAFLAPGEYQVNGEGSLWVVSGKGR